MKKTLLTAAVLGLIAVSAPLSTQAVTQVSHDRGYISVSTSANTKSHRMWQKSLLPCRLLTANQCKKLHN